MNYSMKIIVMDGDEKEKGETITATNAMVMKKRQ